MSACYDTKNSSRDDLAEATFKPRQRLSHSRNINDQCSALSAGNRTNRGRSLVHRIIIPHFDVLDETIIERNIGPLIDNSWSSFRGDSYRVR